MPSHERIHILQGPLDGKMSPTPYSIRLSADGQTVDIKSFGFLPYMRMPVNKSGEPTQTVRFVINNRPVEVIRHPEEAWYQVGSSGMLIMEKDICTFYPRQGSVAFQAKIPDASARDGVFTAMIQFGVDIAEYSGIRG
jgi:hypothetical protein